MSDERFDELDDRGGIEPPEPWPGPIAARPIVYVEPVFVIWSFEHSAWWGWAERGYTPKLEEAGRYTSELAGIIVTNSILGDEVCIAEDVAARRGPPTVRSLWG